MGNCNIVFTQMTPELITLLESCRAKKERFIDCGAGVGEFGSFVQNVVSIDILPDPATKSEIIEIDARAYQFNKSDIPIFIRPDSGSWVYETIINAFHHGCKKAIVITKQNNFISWNVDIPVGIKINKFGDWVGEDGEEIFIIFAIDYFAEKTVKIKTPKKLRFHLFSDALSHEEDIIRCNQQLSNNLFEYQLDAYDTPQYRDKYFDVLLFDWGGMSLGNSMCDWFSRDIINYIREHPSKIVVIISEMTEWSFKDAVKEIGEQVNVFYGFDTYFKFMKDESVNMKPDNNDV